MKNGKIRVLSLLLAIMMVAGIFASCAKAPAETTGGETTDEVETTASPTETDESKESAAKDTTDESIANSSDTEDSNTDESASESSSSSCSASGTEETETKQESSTETPTESETESQTEAVTDEPLLPSLIEGENAPLIELADRLANGVNAYYTDTKRTGYHFYNQNASVTCDLQNTKVVSAISNNSPVDKTAAAAARRKGDATLTALPKDGA